MFTRFLLPLLFLTSFLQCTNFVNQLDNSRYEVHLSCLADGKVVAVLFDKKRNLTIEVDSDHVFFKSSPSSSGLRSLRLLLKYLKHRDQGKEKNREFETILALFFYDRQLDKLRYGAIFDGLLPDTEGSPCDDSRTVPPRNYVLILISEEEQRLSGDER